jgi:hypothetical protein
MVRENYCLSSNPESIPIYTPFRFEQMTECFSQKSARSALFERAKGEQK